MYAHAVFFLDQIKTSANARPQLSRQKRAPGSECLWLEITDVSEERLMERDAAEFLMWFFTAVSTTKWLLPPPPLHWGKYLKDRLKSWRHSWINGNIFGRNGAVRRVYRFTAPWSISGDLGDKTRAAKMWKTSSSDANGCGDRLSSHALSARWINHCRGWERGSRRTRHSKGYRLNLTLIVNLGLAQWTEEACQRRATSRPNWPVSRPRRLDNKRPREGSPKWPLTPRHAKSVFLDDLSPPLRV